MRLAVTALVLEPGSMKIHASMILTERELHRVYGGRVIFQQFGVEALDARRRLFEEAEKKGDIKFDDPGARHMFYYYSHMKHTVINDEKALEKPWFLDDGI